MSKLAPYRWIAAVVVAAGCGFGLLVQSRSIRDLESRREGLEATLATRASEPRAESSPKQAEQPRPMRPSVPEAVPELMPTEASPGEPLLLPASEWQNRGTLTPEAALETALWAARNGELNALANTLLLEGEVREAAESLFHSLAPEQQRRFETPEKLLAGLTLLEMPESDVTIGRLIVQADRPLAMTLRYVEERPYWRRPERSLFVPLQRTESGWRLQVPMEAVERFRLSLSGEPIPSWR